MRRLHIGGKLAAPGWEVLDVSAASHVDHVGDARDLSRFPDDAFAALYASHVLEHLDYKDELTEALAEWLRVLVPGGTAYLSVPDMDVLARLLLREGLAVADRFHLMRILFGGHMDAHDYHQVGLNEALLRTFLEGTGFVQVRRVEDLGFFRDSSTLVLWGVPISLNMVACKPGPPGPPW